MSSTLDFSRIPRSALPGLLARAPKAELHMHIEGSLEPELSFQLAARHGITLPYASVEALREAMDFEDLQSFLNLYYACADVLRTEDDFFELGWAYFQRAAADGIVHAEIFFDPQTHTARGVPMGAVILGLHRASEQARRQLGLSSSLILCFLRHLSEEEALQTLEAALPYREFFIGVGLDSAERDHPPAKFERVFAWARTLGLHVVAHAGEEGPAAYVEQALDLLHAERIDHGVRSIDSPALMQRLAHEGVPLTVCPLSNLKLCVVPDLAEHPLPQLLAAGLRVTINSDDPAYFGGYLLDNFRALFDALPQWGAAEAYALLRNSLQASFVAPEQKVAWMAQLDARFVAAMTPA
ncbi:adenosine deaminase [Roseateles paludis]|uniref:Adenine deaminase n=1 Tax=Roseateles paludis TaxID=3145238 RepID=A0ABV0G787_9BURK